MQWKHEIESNSRSLLTCRQYMDKSRGENIYDNLYHQQYSIQSKNKHTTMIKRQTYAQTQRNLLYGL